MQQWHSKGLDRDLHKKNSDSGENMSSAFVRQLHKNPQCIVASIGHPEATQCHQCFVVKVNNRQIRPLSHCNVFFDVQILPHGLLPNPHQDPAQ